MIRNVERILKVIELGNGETEDQQKYRRSAVEKLYLRKTDTKGRY